MLRQLWVQGNELTAIPDALGDLESLTELRLSGNNLTALPRTLGKLTQLRILDLRFNRIATLPDSLLALTHMTVLDLEGNPLGLPPDLIPELLDKLEAIEAGSFRPAQCLNFEFRYDVLPEGLLPRFVVRTHALSTGLPRWRTGVVLAFEGNRALVKADVQDRRVFVRVDGPAAGRRRLLAIVRSDFDRIHADIKVRPDAFVSLPDHPGAAVRYQRLLTFETKGIETFPHDVGDDVVDIHVRDLLNGIDLEGTVRDVNWRRAPFAGLQPLPQDGKAVSDAPSRDAAWRNVSEGIERVAEEIRKNNQRGFLVRPARNSVRRLDPQSIAERREKMPAVVGHDHGGAPGPRDLGDVGVVDAAPHDRLPRGGLEHREAIGRRQVMNGHPPEHFPLQQNDGVRRRDPELGWQARRDGKELEAAMPRRGRAVDALLRDRMEQQLSGGALRSEVHEAGEQDTGVEEDAHGQRLRSSSISASISITGRSRGLTLGRATRRRPIFTSVGPGATRRSRTPSSSSVISSSEPGVNPARSRMAAGMTTLPALSMVDRMASGYHATPHDSPAGATFLQARKPRPTEDGQGGAENHQNQPNELRLSIDAT